MAAAPGRRREDDREDALMLALLEEIVHVIEPVYVAAGYYLIGTAVLLERSVFVGLLVPGDVILALGGVFAARGRLELAAVIGLGVAAATVGESVGYWMGRRYGDRLIRRVPLLRRLEDRLEAAEEYFEQHGGKTVAVGRYATAAGAFVPFSAGVGRMPYPRFLLFDVPAVVLWATGISLLGYLLGGQLELLDKVLSRFGWVMLALLAAFLGIRIVRRRRRASADDGGDARAEDRAGAGREGG